MENLCMVTFLFNIKKIKDSFYENVAFENIIKGKELLNNENKVIISDGDIFDREFYNDVSPFIIRDELCTINKNDISYKNENDIYAILIEDITINNAKKIDERMKKNFSAYLGMTSVDISSTDKRKQFWKKLVRYCSLEENVITYFGSKKMGFDTIVAKKFNLKINYDNFERESDNKILFSTRQSSFITKAEQLEIKEGKNDSDRGLLEMNFSLVKEVEIAGVLIWKSIEDINKVYLQKKENDVIVDYLFTSLYQASQGIERLFKILIQLIEYEMNLDDKKRIEELLLSHNHIGMYQFISEYQDLKFNENENKFITLISNFYNKIRYHRFRYSENNIPELELLQNFGNNIKEENFDEEIKHKYGKSLGKISHSLYECISKISRKLHIFVEELYSFSVAKFVFWKNIKNFDLYEILKEIEISKKELIWYLLNIDVPKNKNINILPFESSDEEYYIKELIYNKNACEGIYSFVSEIYDQLIDEDKKKWKKRLDFFKKFLK